MARENDKALGCLVINDLLSGKGMLSGLSSCLAACGVHAEDFKPDAAGRLYTQLVSDYARVRKDAAACGLAAEGAGCAMALAIACQLPCDRVVLVDGGTEMGDIMPVELRRQYRRIASFARRNASLCVSDVLLIACGNCAKWTRDLGLTLNNARVWTWELPEMDPGVGKKLINMAACDFLLNGVLPKSLAENAEMCIIYE